MADVACEHVKYCTSSEDQCRSTVNYDEPGQNTRLYTTKSPHESINSILKKGIFGWFEEYNNTTPNIVDSYVERFVGHLIYVSFCVVFSFIHFSLFLFVVEKV